MTSSRCRDRLAVGHPQNSVVQRYGTSDLLLFVPEASAAPAWGVRSGGESVRGEGEGATKVTASADRDLLFSLAHTRMLQGSSGHCLRR